MSGMPFTPLGVGMQYHPTKVPSLPASFALIIPLLARHSLIKLFTLPSGVIVFILPTSFALREIRPLPNNYNRSAAALAWISRRGHALLSPLLFLQLSTLHHGHKGPGVAGNRSRRHASSILKASAIPSSHTLLTSAFVTGCIGVVLLSCAVQI